MITIAHISDTHVGSPHFVPNLMNRVIAELNELAPELVIHTGDITNDGTITNTGGAPGVANMIFNADAFNLAGGHIEAGAAAVVLRPRTGTNSFGIEAAGQTTLTNADIASINTSDFVVFGSGIGTTFTGNMTIGENAQVNGGGKHLAFFRSPTAGGTTTIGSQGVATTGDVIISAGGGAIMSNGGTVAGDEVQLRAGQGIGAPGARVHTAANALGISNLGGAGAFLSEADDVTLRPISLNVGGIINNAGSNTAGMFDFSTGGNLTVAGTVSSNGLMNINVAGALNIVGSGGLDTELLSGGGQNITAQSVTLSGRDNRRGNIRNTGGNQSVSATAGGMTLQGSGGAGVAWPPGAMILNVSTISFLAIGSYLPPWPRDSPGKPFPAREGRLGGAGGLGCRPRAAPGVVSIGGKGKRGN